MSVSMKDLFGRREAIAAYVSLRNSLANHLDGPGLTLRQAAGSFSRHDAGDGFSAGCRRAEQIRIGIEVPLVDLGPLEGGFGVANLVPAWVPVDLRDHRGRPRTLEGVLVRSKMTDEDFPLQPWHTFYDWNFFVHVDPQYKYLVSEIAAEHNTKKVFGSDQARDIIECEWDSAFVPLEALPQENSRVWMMGRWIYDCGHAEKGRHRTELHPLLAIASFRSEGILFPGNRGPTQANNAVLYISPRGGYIQQAVNDQDFVFELPLPPRPSASAAPLSKVVPTKGVLPVEPIFTPFPESAPRSFLVTIPLKNLSPAPVEYGAVVSAGWSDPEGTETTRTKRFRITIEKIVARSIPPLNPAPRWLFLICVNGRWHKRELSHPETLLNEPVELTLHDDDEIRITACGFQRRGISGFMGQESGVANELVGKPSPLDDAKSAAGKMARALAKTTVFGAGIPTSFSNDPIDLFLKTHKPVEEGRFEARSADNRSRHPIPGAKSYEVHYRIQRI